MSEKKPFINWTNESGFNRVNEAESTAEMMIANGRIIVRFPKSPNGLTISMSPRLARWFADELIKRADEIEAPTLPIAQTLPPVDQQGGAG